MQSTSKVTYLPQQQLLGRCLLLLLRAVSLLLENARVNNARYSRGEYRARAARSRVNCAYVLRISRYSGFLWVVPTNTGIFLRGLYTEKAEVSKCSWYPNEKLGVTMHFSQIIKLQIGKRKRHTLHCILLLSMPRHTQFSFWFPAAHTKICFSHIVINCATILLY